MNNIDYVVVNVNGGYDSVYSFCTPEDANEIIERATEKARENIETYKSHLVNYPNMTEHWERQIAHYENVKYECMTFDEFLDRQKKEMTSGEVTEVTEDIYNEQLNCLPPLKWCTRNGYSMFCMCEMYTGTYTTQYAKKDGKFYSAMVDVTDESTWIHNRLMA